MVTEWPDEQWALIHKLNGQLIRALSGLLVEKINWDPKKWIVTVLVLQRTFEEIEEAVLKTSSTMFKGKIFDAYEDCDLEDGVGDLNRIVPLVKSFAGYCVRSGNILWVDEIDSHPLRPEYRLYEYVNVRPEAKLVAEYVFPIRVKIGLNQTVVGVLNAETTREKTNEFKEVGFHHISKLMLRLLDTHGPFLLLSQLTTTDRRAARSLLKAHSNVLESTIRDFATT